MMARVAVRRTGHRLLPDPRRVIAKPFLPDDRMVSETDTRADLLMRRILDIPDGEVGALLSTVLERFSQRHADYEGLLERHFALAALHASQEVAGLSRERRLLIGAYFTHEYSVESAALFNPSLVPSPDQTGVAPGKRRAVMSLRGVGEGHVSSIEFRSLVIGPGGALAFDPPGPRLVTGERTWPSHFEKRPFAMELSGLGAGNEMAWAVLERLPERFTFAELERSLARLEEEGTPPAISQATRQIIRVLADSHYVTTFPAGSALSERVIFPGGAHESRGMEDARFVRFIEEDGSARYYATYTAYDGFGVLPRLIETEDFLSFAVSTLSGSAAQNKGMALFPRRIAGRYVMLSRRDRENLYLATSDDVGIWNDEILIDKPEAPWELLQIGNCGSPLETEAGWLVLTHGVGAMRRYAIGALLLDLGDPRRVLGRLPYPLLEPDETEREGYVPNVVYSCGGLIHGDDLVLPYGISDGAIGVALVSVPDLLAALTKFA